MTENSTCFCTNRLPILYLPSCDRVFPQSWRLFLQKYGAQKNEFSRRKNDTLPKRQSFHGIATESEPKARAAATTRRRRLAEGGPSSPRGVGRVSPAGVFATFGNRGLQDVLREVIRSTARPSRSAMKGTNASVSSCMLLSLLVNKLSRATFYRCLFLRSLACLTFTPRETSGVVLMGQGEHRHLPRMGTAGYGR